VAIGPGLTAFDEDAGRQKFTREGAGKREKAITDLQGRFCVNNGDLLRDAAVAGLGIALLPMFIAAAGIRGGQLSTIEIDVRAEEEFIFIAHPQGRRASAKFRALAEHLRTAFGAPPYWEGI
jgi:DNA-binding transcriptional LysR family regulator